MKVERIYVYHEFGHGPIQRSSTFTRSQIKKLK